MIPLNSLLKGSDEGNAPVRWNEIAENAFVEIKEGLAHAKLLAHPKLGAPANITVDASDYAIGAVLQQEIKDTCESLAFYTKTLSTAQQKCSAYDRELLAAYCAINHFRPFHSRAKFYIIHIS